MYNEPTYSDIAKNTFNDECVQIANNIRKCISHTLSPQIQTNTFAFTTKQPQLLMLSLHCESEIAQLQTELAKRHTRMKYQLIYTTHTPYTVTVDSGNNLVTISQPNVFFS
jgi:hypothetical protein